MVAILLQGNRDFILCRNGICRFVSREDIENLPEAQSGKQILEDTFNIKIRDKEEPITEKTIVPLKLDAKEEPKDSEIISESIEDKPIESKTVYESPMIVSSPKLQERGPVEVSVIAVTEESLGNQMTILLIINQHNFEFLRIHGQLHLYVILVLE